MLTDPVRFRPILRRTRMKSPISPLFCALALVISCVPAWGSQAQPAQNTLVRVFLDCNHCDESYLKKEVTFIDYIRNREDADVHLLVTLQETGGGGAQWTLKFIGLGRFQGKDQTLTYNSPQTATSDEVRAGFAEVFKLGLVQYAAQSPIADRLRVTFKKAEGDEAKPAGKDPWNFWVYRIRGNGDVNGEESSKGRAIEGSFEASRTTDGWRTSLEASAGYRDSEFVLDDEEEEGKKSTFLSVRRELEASAILVKSLNQHWSFGVMSSAESQTFRNFAVRTRFAPGIEYNLFPYSESTRRMLTFQYTFGHAFHRYRETTIFGKLREQLVDQRAEIGLSLRQPWGSANAEFNFSQYLNNPSKYSLGLDGGTEIRLFKGFTVNFFGEYSRTRDQIYLPLGEASTEEILLRQRQLLTGYQYFFNFGFGYSFGSIFNNIVNPRFGGGG
jgi:hypothetical protein